MADYKHTLNLPKTAFPMKANLANREPQMLKRWQEADIYSQIRASRKGSKPYILHDGPPYANGDIHIGHAVNKILKDIIVKAKSLSGYDAPYIPGWDCHGLPIELMVEKKIGKAGHKVDAKTFRRACRDYAKKQVARQRAGFERLGVLGDWDNPYLTMDFRFEADIIRSLGRIVEAKHLHKGFKPVHWCPQCGSALAEAEVEHEEKTSPSIDVAFTAVDETTLLKCFPTPMKQSEGRVAVVIWTTTPWTLPANQAVALNPELQYVLVQCQLDGVAWRLLLAEALVDDIMQRWDCSDYTVLGQCNGAAFEGILLQHPFYPRQVPIILGDHVTLDAGTGAVHTAPGHGQDDFVVGMRYNLPVDNPVDATGKFLPDTELFAGEYVFKANDPIIDLLRNNGALLHTQPIRHSYPHCWRHKTPIIFRATPQWFISMTQNGLRDSALEAIKQVQWKPGWGEARIESMVNNRPDWCISRQRTWGVPIALFVDKASGEPHPDTANLIERVAQLVEQQGIDAWFDLDPKQLLGDDADNYDKVTDTLDVWFDSGVTHACVLEQRESLRFPADLYLEGSDQHRGWFQSSLLTSVAMHGHAPYRAVLTHGFAVDGQGRKMSKSVGNVIAPEKVANTLGADIIRLWVASTDYSAEMSVSDEILKRTADTYRRLRNTARFLLANINGFNPESDLVAADDMVALDRWAVSRALQLQAEIIAAYESFEFHLIYQKVHNFCTVEMGSFYLDIIKDRQYTTQPDSIARRSAQSAMYHIVEALARWLAPILSFSAEEIWGHLPGERGASVFLARWYTPCNDFLTETQTLGLSYWKQVTAVRDAVSKELEALRAAGEIGSPLDAEINLYCDPQNHALLTQLDDELRFVLITSYAQIHPLADKPAKLSTTTLASGGEIAIQASASVHPKCARCWHHRAEVGQDETHPALCGRCLQNVAGSGETRRFA
ncbi:MAG: isoleucine--tRNA ligase [Gammaproteobacteria bacterium]|nr:isoleucine--tRNA ligase [Gammaproteobacteria bacterium]